MTTANQFVDVSLENGVARVTLNRPEKRNALKREFIEELLAAVTAIALNESIRVFVLAARGSVFCAGMDLGQMQERAQSDDGKAEWSRDSEVYCELLAAIYSLSIPTIAVVGGAALAGGMGLVLACDIVIASDNAFFMLPEPMRGITAAMVTPFLIHRIGTGPATYFLLSGERVSAERCRGFGLCHDVTTGEELVPRCEKLIEAVLTGSQSALAITKKHISKCLEYDLLALVKMSIDVSALARETDDAREGLAAFLEKRKPNWQSQ